MSRQAGAAGARGRLRREGPAAMPPARDWVRLLVGTSHGTHLVVVCRQSWTIADVKGKRLPPGTAASTAPLDVWKASVATCSCRG